MGDHRNYALGTAAGLAVWLLLGGEPVWGLFGSYIALLGRVVLTARTTSQETDHAE